MAIKFLSGLNLSDVTAGSILKLDSNGKIVAAVDGTDYNTGSADSWSDVGVNIYRNSDVRIGTYQSGVAPDARLHVFDYQTTDPKLLIEDGNTGDASMQFKISTQSYTMGIDNSDSDKFVLAASSALGTTNAIEVSTSGTTTFKSTAYFQGDAYFDGNGQTFYFTADNTDRTTIRWQIDGGNKYVLSTVGANSLYWGRESGNTSGHIELDTPIRITGSLTVNTDSYTDTITTGHSGTLNLIDTKTLILDDSFGTSDGRVFGVLQPASFKPSDITLGDSAYSSAATGSYVTNNYPNVKGESDATGITDGATFTFAEALDQAETLGGRLPTLEEIMSGVGRGSGQGYDNEYIWTQTKAGHGRYWVARGSAVTTNDAIVVDINASTPPEYRMRIFYDISKDNMPVYYDNSSNIRATSIKAENSDGIALRALDGDIGITVTDDGNVKFNQYTAGLLKTDSVGNISLDTNTYLTSVSVDWNDIGSVQDSIDLNSTVQIGQGDTETIVSFQNSGTERGRFEVDDSANSYFVATGFKTSTASTGFLKADGTVDTNTYSTATGVANNADVTPSWVPSTDPGYATTDYVDTELTGLASESWANTNLVNVSGDTMSGTLRLPWKWNSTDITANSFYVQRSATEDGFAFGIGTGVSTWFSWDGSVGTKRAIDVWNDGSKILLGDGGHNTEISNDLYVPSRIYHTNDTDTYMQFHAGDQWRVVTGGTERLEVNNTATTVANTLTASGGINGLTLANGGISGSNYNITGVNQLEIADPGEGIVFKSGSSGDMTLAIVDDSSDNILRFSGTNAIFDVAGSLSSTNLTIADAIYHEGDTNTSISFGTDTINLNTGGGVRASISDSGAKFNNNTIIAGGATLSLGERAEADDNGRTVLIEGAANAGSGEGAGRIFFTEHNSTDASADKYGLSLYYEGDPNIALPSGFQPNTGNGTWSLRRHNDSVNGAAIMSGTRTSNNVLFSGTVTVGGALNIPEYIYHNGDTNTYVRFTGDRIRIVAGGSTKFDSNNTYLLDVTPAAPSVTAANIVGETIEVVFEASTTADVDYYQVWSSVNGGSYGMIAQIPDTDFAATMTVVDAAFEVSGDITYRVYAVKSGIYSTPGTASATFTASSLEVTNMSVVSLNTAYYIQYDMPASRFVDHVEIYMDAEAASGDLNRTGATLIYSGSNTSYMYQIGASDLDKFHQFWVEVIES